jgi:hypothetical protein
MLCSSHLIALYKKKYSVGSWIQSRVSGRTDRVFVASISWTFGLSSVGDICYNSRVSWGTNDDYAHIRLPHVCRGRYPMLRSRKVSVWILWTSASLLGELETVNVIGWQERKVRSSKMRAKTRRPPERNTNMFKFRGTRGAEGLESLGDVPSQHQSTTSCIMSKVAVIDSEGTRGQFRTSLRIIPAAETEESWESNFIHAFAARVPIYRDLGYLSTATTSLSKWLRLVTFLRNCTIDTQSAFFCVESIWGVVFSNFDT